MHPPQAVKRGHDAASPLDRVAAVLARALHSGHRDEVAAARGREATAALQAGGYQAAAQRLLDWLGAHEEDAARFGRAAVWITALTDEWCQPPFAPTASATARAAASAP